MDLRFRIDALDLVLTLRDKTHSECQRTDTAEEHDRYDRELTPCRELRRRRGGKTYGTEGGCRFKHQIEECKLP